MDASIQHTMELNKARSERDAARHVVSRAIQVLHQARVALEEDDTEEALSIIEAATEGSQLQEPFRVSVQRMKESHRVTYWVTLDRGDRPKDASPFETEGRITPSLHENLEHANHEAEEYAKFLGVEFEPYVEAPVDA